MSVPCPDCRLQSCQQTCHTHRHCSSDLPSHTWLCRHYTHPDACKLTLFLVHAPQRIMCGNTTLTQGERECVPHSSALISISLDMSLLNVPFSRFPHVLSSPSCPASQTSAISTSFCGSGNDPCASARWSGMSGRMANPTQNTGSREELPRHHIITACVVSGNSRDRGRGPRVSLKPSAVGW